MTLGTGAGLAPLSAVSAALLTMTNCAAHTDPADVWMALKCQVPRVLLEGYCQPAREGFCPRCASVTPWHVAIDRKYFPLTFYFLKSLTYRKWENNIRIAIYSSPRPKQLLSLCLFALSPSPLLPLAHYSPSFSTPLSPSLPFPFLLLSFFLHLSISLLFEFKFRTSGHFTLKSSACVL